MFHGAFDGQVSCHNDKGFDQVENSNTYVKVRLKLEADVQASHCHQSPKHDEFHYFLDSQFFVAEAVLL
jgi:hypothetical protein